MKNSISHNIKKHIFFYSHQDSRQVGFEVPSNEDDDFYKRPLKLHRRDTPHHLKNKRVNSGKIDKDTTEILKNAIMQQQVEEEQQEPTTTTEQPTEQKDGKFDRPDSQMICFN